MKRILLINGHPDPESFCQGLARAYEDGAVTAGADLKTIRIADLQFNPNLQFGYRQRMTLEPDLLDAWEKIQWAQHLVWVFPVWWGSVPAITKGFLDRLFLPGMAFSKKEHSVWYNKLLKGRSARIITTMDQPGWWYLLVNRRPSHWAMKKLTLNFCGISPVKTTIVGNVNRTTEKERLRSLEKIRQLGIKLG